MDLIVVDSIYMSVYKKSWGDTPFIIRTHNVEHQIWERTLSSTKLSFKNIFIQWQTRKLKKWETNLIRGSRVWPITEADSVNIKKLGAKSTEVFPCTFNHEKTWTFSGSASNKLYHLGALDWEPNIIAMSWFVKSVIPKISDKIQITVYSNIWPESIDQHETINWNNSSTRDIPFQDYGIFIAPLLSGSGMRIKLLEAMSRGKAIVTTTIGAEGLLCKNKMHLYIADTAEEFANAISELYNDSNYRCQMGACAREHALNNFSDELFVKKMKNIEARA
jgi:glycosyltransferase involved in cell wall biosynthesis